MITYCMGGMPPVRHLPNQNHAFVNRKIYPEKCFLQLIKLFFIHWLLVSIP